MLALNWLRRIYDSKTSDAAEKLSQSMPPPFTDDTMGFYGEGTATHTHTDTWKKAAERNVTSSSVHVALYLKKIKFMICIKNDTTLYWCGFFMGAHILTIERKWFKKSVTIHSHVLYGQWMLLLWKCACNRVLLFPWCHLVRHIKPIFHQQQQIVWYPRKLEPIQIYEN